MERLKGNTILVGKEPSTGSLMIYLTNSGKAATIGLPGSVPNSVSRCKAAEGVAHVQIKIDDNGNITVTNMKPQNITVVNGNEIQSKRVSSDATLELGRDRFVVSLRAILTQAEKLVPVTPPKPKRFRISHLENVWNEYQDSLRNLKEKQKSINLMRTGFSVFTLMAMPCIHIFGPIGFVLTGIGILGAIYSFFILKNDDTSEKQEKILENFQDHYVCPNPGCNKFLGNMSYKLIKKQYSMHCPYCKSEFYE